MLEKCDGSQHLWERKTYADLQQVEIARGLQSAPCLCFVAQVQGFAHYIFKWMKRRRRHFTLSVVQKR